MTGQASLAAVSGAGEPSPNATVTVPDQASDAGALLAGANVGLAMFDKDLRLLACNEPYRVLRCHEPEEVVAGAQLFDLVRRVLEREGMGPVEAETRMALVRSRLFPGNTDAFRYVSPAGKLIEVHRQCLQGGTVVETVRELEPSSGAADLNVQFAKIAASARERMMQALDVMAEGFALFDAGGRLLVFNRKYLESRKLVAEMVVVGASYEDMLREEVRRGAIDLTGTTAEKYIERRIHWHNNPTEPMEVLRADGSWLRISETRTSEGGWVQTRSDISLMKQREADLLRLTRELHTRSSMFDVILKNMSQGLCLFDADQKVVFANRRYADIYGLKPEDVAPGATLKSIIEARLATGLYDNIDHAEYMKYGLETFSQKVSEVVRLNDGRVIAVLRVPMPDGSLVSTHEDVTERETLNARIADQHMQFEAALDSMVQGLAMYDADHRLTVCNQRYLDMFHMSPDVVKPGVSLEDVMMHSAHVGNYSEEEARRVLKERIEGRHQTVRRTFTQRMRDGRVIAVMSEPMQSGGTIATCLDITEMDRHTQQLNEYNQKLERSNRELQDFAYVASHDLQEPLRKIEAFGDRLFTRHGKNLPEDGQMFLERMQNAAGRMRRLINDLLDYSRVTTKAKPFVRVSLDEVLAGVLSDLQIRIEESAAVVTADPLPVIDADMTQMRQLLQNVIANALKFRKPDVAPRVSISCTLGESNDLYGQLVRIAITDNGIGFDNRYKEQIFTIFQRLHGRLEYEGTGVGLATVRKIVERHCGTIDADGRPGEGATFIIELPLKQKAEDVYTASK